MKQLLLAFIVGLLIFSSCSNNTDKAYNNIGWSPFIDSLLNDSTKINPIADSVRLQVLHSETDSTALCWLNEFSEQLMDVNGLLVATAVLKKSRSINCHYTESDALCRLAIYYFRQSNYVTADSLLNSSLLESKKYKFKVLESQALFWRGEICRMDDQNGKALDYFAQSLSIAKADNDKRRTARCLESMGAVNYMIDDNKKALDYLNQALKLSQEINDKYIQVLCLENIGQVNRYEGKYDEALLKFESAMQLAIQINDKRNIGYNLSSEGDVYRMQNNTPKALECFNRCLKISIETKDKRSTAFCLKSMGIVHNNEHEFDKALNYYISSLDLYKQLDDKFGITSCLRSIGETYKTQNKYPQALKCHKEAIAIAREIGNKSGICFSLTAMGDIYRLQNESDFVKENIDPKERYSKSYACYNEALLIAEGLNSNNRLATSLKGLGEINFQQKHITEAVNYAERSLTAAKASGVPDNISLSAELLYRIYNSQLQSEKALNMYRLHVQMKDSISNEEEIKKFAAVEYKGKEERMRSDQETKEKVFKIEQEKNEQEIRNQKTVRNVLIGGFSLLCVLVFIIFRSLQQNKKAKAIIEVQKKEVEGKQEEIISSISYAKRLQGAILPPLEMVNQHFSDSFVLYLPKDIVAGDFFWMEVIGAAKSKSIGQKVSGMVFIAAADSTGHGVPGAMVSVVCSNALNRSVKEFGLRETGKILDKARELVIETFVRKDSYGEKSEDVKDGMDISLLCIDYENKEICWSGANNPLWYIEQGELKEIKGDKQPIGKQDNPHPFTTHKIKYDADTTFYLITDGYADQFGGPKGKKFKYKKLQQILLEGSSGAMTEQKKTLESSLASWIGNLEQVDDITLIGVKL